MTALRVALLLMQIVAYLLQRSRETGIKNAESDRLLLESENASKNAILEADRIRNSIKSGSLPSLTEDPNRRD